MKTKSGISLSLCYVLIFLIAFVIYPKWDKDYSESTFGWDVFGYYMYLPATFIYEDLGQLSFAPAILEQYRFTGDFQQAYPVDNGNHILKYSCGQSVSYLPFFMIAHGIALNSDYPADGFSKPYQFMICLGNMLITFLGLFYLRRILRLWFGDLVVGLTLLVLVFASNYLEYSAINGALTHNYLFTLYCLLIWYSHKLIEEPKMGRAIGVGLIIGLAALTRPTEIIAVLIPLLWGIPNIGLTALKDRLYFLIEYKGKLMVAALVCVLIGSLQLIYWKVIGGQWLIYSYQGEEFTWLHPHVMDALFSYRTGWLIYSPAMWFSVFGFYFLYQKDTSLFWPCFLFALLFTYIVTAWDNWWYGGGLGLRAMVQSYPILAFPMAACLAFLLKNKFGKLLLFLLFPLFIYLNLWTTYNAHKGHQYHAGQMTKTYFWKTLGQVKHDPMDLRFLDTDEYFTADRKNIQTIYENNFEGDTSLWKCTMAPSTHTGQLCIQKDNLHLQVPASRLTSDCEWLRVSGHFYAHGAEYEFWKMSQIDVSFYKEGQKIKHRLIRANRLFQYKVHDIYFDVQVPEQPVDSISLSFFNGYSDVPFIGDWVRVECFE